MIIERIEPPKEVTPAYTREGYQYGVALPKAPLTLIDIVRQTYDTRKVEVGYVKIKGAAWQTAEIPFKTSFDQEPALVFKTLGWITIPWVNIYIPIPVICLGVDKDKFYLWSMFGDYSVSYIAFEQK
jgi:hypothetical protein